MPHVYIIQLSNGKYYVGSTENLARRMLEHSQGASPYTSHYLPVTLVFSQEYESIHNARLVEMWIKKQKDKRLIIKIIEEKSIKKTFW
jgi:putative endonuclease